MWQFPYTCIKNIISLLSSKFQLCQFSIVIKLRILKHPLSQFYRSQGWHSSSDFFVLCLRTCSPGDSRILQLRLQVLCSSLYPRHSGFPTFRQWPLGFVGASTSLLSQPRPSSIQQWHMGPPHSSYFLPFVSLGSMIRSGRPTWRGTGGSAYHKINCAHDDKSIFSSYILDWRLDKDITGKPFPTFSL